MSAGHRGIVEYDPRELVLTARSGTTLQEIEAALAEANQMLAFEPPHFGDSATLGGTIACGLSGPRRPYSGSARDFVLGCQLLNGRGEILRFGGQVMKNVAGYDVSRLMAGAYGTLGILLEISLKVLPRPRGQHHRRARMQRGRSDREHERVAEQTVSGGRRVLSRRTIVMCASPAARRRSRKRAARSPATWCRMRMHSGMRCASISCPSSSTAARCIASWSSPPRRR